MDRSLYDPRWLKVYDASLLGALPANAEWVSASPSGAGARLRAEDLASLAGRVALRGFGAWSASEVPDEAWAAFIAAHPALEALELLDAKQMRESTFARLAARPLRELEVRDADLVRGESLGAFTGLREARVARCASLAVARVASAPALESLSLTLRALSREDLAALAAHPRLRALRLPRSTWEPGAIAALAAAPALERLSLDQPLTPDEARALCASPALARLRAIVGSLADVDALAAFDGHPRVQVEVAFVAPPGANDATLARLADALPSLAALDLNQMHSGSGSWPFTPQGAATLARLRSLRRLDLLHTSPKWGVADLAFLASLGPIEELRLHPTKKLPASALDAIKPLTTLRHLEFANVAVSDAAAKKLAALPLESLSLSGTTLGDKGLAHLAALRSLRTLAVTTEKSTLTDAGLAAIGALPALERAYLSLAASDCAFSALAPLGALPSLEALCLVARGTMTAAWLDSLATARSLVHFSTGHLPWSAEAPDAMLDALARFPSLRQFDGARWPHAGAARERFLAGGPWCGDGNGVMYPEAFPRTFA